MEGRCEESTCNKIGHGVFRVSMKSRPFERTIDGLVMLQWTKRKTCDKVLCIECGFDLINQRYATLIHKGTHIERGGEVEITDDERWVRGDRYESVTILYSLPNGAEYLAWAKDWQREKAAEASHKGHSSPRQAFTTPLASSAIRPRLRSA